MNLDIESHDRELAFELLNTKTLDQSAMIALPGGVKVRYRGTLMRKSQGFPELSHFLIEFASSAAASVVAAAVWEWLRKGVKNKPERIVIDRIEVEFEEGAIKRVVRERLEKGSEEE